MGLSPAKLQRALPELEKEGLIERERHTFAGRVAAFVRPTALALHLSRNAGVSEEMTAEMGAEKSAEIITTLPSPLSVHSNEKGPGKAQREEKKAKKLQLAPSASSVPVPTSPSDDLLKQLKAIKHKKMPKASKRGLLLELLPAKKGYHEKHVQHPSEKYPHWHTWSPELHVQKQAKYEEYVANWYGGKKGAQYAELENDDGYWEKLAATGSKAAK